MIRPIEPINFLKQSTQYPVIDVRSPGEFFQGHIPGACNISLFDDTERAVVGTLYVQSGREYAILKGLDFSLPKTAWFIDSLKRISPSGRILLHCWRGGLRSTLMAELFNRAGFEVDVLTGGYKAYRHFIRTELALPARIIVLGGYTGSGKTMLLKSIAARGEQVVDLEGLACHKGSVFGAMGQPEQPTNEQFENNLYARWSELDFSKTVWLEDESRMIGRITLPEPIVNHLKASPLVKIEIEDAKIRIERLVQEYSRFDKKLLADAVMRISERLGGTRTKDAISALENNRFHEVAAIVLSYYDKAYLHSMEQRAPHQLHKIHIPGVDHDLDASLIIQFASKCIVHGNDIP
jgi:tRNA 2-selenouridine synthase